MISKKNRNFRLEFSNEDKNMEKSDSSSRSTPEDDEIDIEEYMLKIENMTQKAKNSISTTWQDLKKLEEFSRNKNQRIGLIEHYEDNELNNEILENDIDFLAFKIRNKVLRNCKTLKKPNWKKQYEALLKKSLLRGKSDFDDILPITLKQRVNFLLGKLNQSRKHEDFELTLKKYFQNSKDKFKVALALKMIEIHEVDYKTKSELGLKRSKFFKFQHKKKSAFHSLSSVSKLKSHRDDFIVIKEARDSNRKGSRDNKTLVFSESNLSEFDINNLISYRSIPKPKGKYLRRDGKSVDILNY